MKIHFLIFILIVTSFSQLAQSQPSNDECIGAIVLTNLNNWCSPNGSYTNVSATQTLATSPTCWTGDPPSHDVWFSFTAVANTINFIVDGSNGGGTLVRPQIAIFTGSCNPFNMWQIGCNQFTTNNIGYANLYLSGLNIGQTYYILVDGFNNNTGTFKLCINNFNSPEAPGQDCVSGAWLCNKDAITQQALVGAGIIETQGTCLQDPYIGPTDKNTIWYKWVCEAPGTVTFSINPLIPLDDIDWVFYELPNGNCNSRIPLRCNSSACVGATGLLAGSTNINIYPGCNGILNELWCAPVDMEVGKTYGLLINNWTDASVGLDNGFTLTFGGSGTFVGPKSDFTISPDPPYCIGDILTFTDESTGGGTSYSWNFGQNASISTANTIGPHNISYTSSGTKTIVLTVSDGSCNDVSFQTIIIEECCEQPIIQNQPQGALICNQNSHTFSVTATGSGPLTYQWQLNGVDIPGATNATYTISPILPSDTGSYTCIISDAGCSTETNPAVLAYGIIPQPDFFANPVSGCAPLTVQFIDNTIDTVVSYAWNFGNASSPSNTSSLAQPTHTYNNAGTYSVTLTVISTDGCSGTTTLHDFIQVHPNPIVSFTHTPFQIFEDAPTVTFVNTSSGNNTYLWQFGENLGTSNMPNPIFTFPGSGDFIVWLIAENIYGCKDSTSKTIHILPFVSFYIPNAFSPNNDGMNDYFMPYGSNIDPEAFKMMIFDRWGKLIFKTENINTPWDGKVFPNSDKIVPIGTYIYVIQAKISGIDNMFRGSVTVIY